MISINNYTKSYIDSSRKKIEEQVAIYKKLVPSRKNMDAVKNFEPDFFNNLVLTLDYYFLHRSRIPEMNQSSASSEVRTICHSLRNCNGIMTPCEGCVYDPENAVLKYKPGYMIKLTQKQFSRLYKAFFADIEKKFL